MALLDVRGVRVNFPFQPYPCQVTYMEKVLQCLQKAENRVLEISTGTGKTLCILCSSLAWLEGRKAESGVLESPTGTGKTLCLLCSTLAWLEGRKAQVELSRQVGVAALMAEAGKENLEQSALAAMAASLNKATGSAASWGASEFVVPKIIYASRTHSQLSQAVQELKRTAYNSVKTAIIGSREQLCINEQVKKEKNNSAKVHLCRAKVSTKRCHYYNVLEDLKRNTEARQVVGSVTDIEDLVSHGTKSKICPYYLARELKSDADIIFMPYNYLLDPKSRRAHGIELQGNIIIFDEAHNLERICEESASFDLSSVELATAIEEMTHLGVQLTDLVTSEGDGGDMGDGAVEEVTHLGVQLTDLVTSEGVMGDGVVEEVTHLGVQLTDMVTSEEEVTHLGVQLTDLVTSEGGGGNMGDGAVEEVTHLGVQLTDMVTSEVPEFTLEDVIKLKKTLLELEELIDAEPLTNKEITKPGMFMFELMAKVNITFHNKSFVTDLIDKMISHFNSDGTSSALHSKGAGLSKVVDAIKIIFNQEPAENSSVSQHRETLAQHYKVHIQLKESKFQKKKLDSWASAGAQDKSERVLSYWCFSPGYSMQELKAQGVQSIILTSGTLSPIESFTSEMQIPFSVSLQNPHVIEKHQVWVGTLGCGPDGATLNSSYHNRFTEAYQSSLGNSIVNFARVVPNGLLVFFPSYPVMEKCVETWQNTGREVRGVVPTSVEKKVKERGDGCLTPQRAVWEQTSQYELVNTDCRAVWEQTSQYELVNTGGAVWDRIVAYKPVVLEPRGKDAFTQAMDDFYEKIGDSKLNGAIFMAVCRGKVSEGLDFADMNGRAVILTGLPFPPMKDPRVMLKMQHLDSLRGKQGAVGLTGQQWYRQQATRAVNQSIGRVIRHKDDFGAIMLCDSRFSSQESINGLPLWVRPHVTKYDNFGRAVRDMLQFFKVAEKMNTPTSADSQCPFQLPAPVARAARQKGGGGTGGSGGAYFEPTMSRHVNVVEPASSVTCHVPGLSKHGTTQNQEACLASLKSQYSGPSDQGTGKQGLLQALDSMEKCTELSSSTPDAQRPESVKGDSTSEPSAPGVRAGARAPVQKTRTHHHMAESYLAEVKAVLTVGDYKRFSAMLQDYRKCGSLGTVTPVLADLFTARSDLFPLFRKFYRFVRPNHKAEFDRLCVSLTGGSCDYQPEDALTGKRLLDNADVTTAPKEKQSKLASACGGDSSSNSSSTTLGQWSASSLAPPGASSSSTQDAADISGRQAVPGGVRTDSEAKKPAASAVCAWTSHDPVRLLTPYDP
ncbi:hypothetical protein ACOMHN_037478 [Nucella lapillus]